MPKTTKRLTTDWESPRLKEKSFCIIGKLKWTDLNNVEKLISAEGGQVVGDVTEALDYLVIGDATPARGKPAAVKKAETLNQKTNADIKILDERGLHKLFAVDRETAAAMLNAGKPGVERWDKTLGKPWLQLKVDLTGADFRGAALNRVDFKNAKLDGADFQNAKLNGAHFSDVNGCNFDGADLNAAGSIRVTRISTATACTFREAQIDGLQMPNARRCDLTGAVGKNCIFMEFVDCVLQDVKIANIRLGEISGCNWTGASIPDVKCHGSCGPRPKNVFDRADMSNFHGSEQSFPNCSFIETNLQKADLSSGSLKGSKLAGANLQQANLRDADLSGCDLTNADLRGAQLAGAKLVGAIVAGANFKDADTRDVDFAKVDTSKAKHLKPPDDSFQGAIGPKARELEKIAAQTFWISTAIPVVRDGKRSTVTLHADNIRGVSRRCEISGDVESRFTDPKATVGDLMLRGAKRMSGGEPQLAAIKTESAVKCQLKPKELARLALEAWCEAFGVELPDDEKLGRAKKTKAAKERDETQQALTELRGGSAGVKKWNARHVDDRKRLGKFRKADFSGTDLTGANFEGADFQQANFKRATLRDVITHGCKFVKADFQECRFGGEVYGNFNDANLRGAILDDVQFTCASFRRADFRGAQICSTLFSDCDLRGANFEGARITEWSSRFGTKFDEHTVFPHGFVLPPDKGWEMQWKGAGKDPRLLEQIKITKTKNTAPIDFESFMQRLEENFDASRLKKALSMLKSESFQLYAQVEQDSVTGVVKSQTDPDLVYACRLDAAGTFACCTQNLNPCGGLRGALCKHLLVLIVGLTKGNELDPTSVHGWVAASKLQAPQLDKNQMSEVFLRYKGAEAGEIDWRPTETVPEDYYAF